MKSKGMGTGNGLFFWHFDWLFLRLTKAALIHWRDYQQVSAHLLWIWHYETKEEEHFSGAATVCRFTCLALLCPTGIPRCCHPISNNEGTLECWHGNANICYDAHNAIIHYTGACYSETSILGMLASKGHCCHWTAFHWTASSPSRVLKGTFQNVLRPNSESDTCSSHLNCMGEQALHRI